MFLPPIAGISLMQLADSFQRLSTGSFCGSEARLTHETIGTDNEHISLKPRCNPPKGAVFEMPETVVSPVIAELRARIERLEGGQARARQVLPFGVPEIDGKRDRWEKRRVGAGLPS